MNSRSFRKSLVSLVLVGAAVPAFLNCGGAGMPGAPGGGGLPSMPDVPGGCKLDLVSADAAAKADFAGEFKFDAATTAKLKAGTEAALEIQELAAKVDADLKAACGKFSADLGGPSDFKTGNEACLSLKSTIDGVRGKLGASAQIAVDIQPPHCGASMDAYADCAGKCDATVTPGSVEASCDPGKLQGSCDAECKGSCEMSAAAACTGKCSGSCDAKFTGTCGGKCDGKCDGKTSSGAKCDGKCEGKCDAGASGSCGGSCGGSCEMTGSAKCNGTCSGSCSVKMKAPKCTGEVKPPKMSADCKAHCDAKVSAKAECTPAKVAVVVKGAADAALATKYAAVVMADFPAVLKIAMGLGDHALAAAGNVKVAVEGLKASFETMAKGNGSAGANPGLVTAHLGACLLAPFKGAIDAAGSVKANVNVSVDVKASASASGSAGGGAKAENDGAKGAAPKG